MATYNVAVPVVELVEAASEAEAVAALRDRLTRAGFDPYEGTVESAGGDAFESDTDLPQPLPAEGTVVEVFVQGHGPRLGIVSNIPPVRHVLRVTGKPLNGSTEYVRVQDADGTTDDPGIRRLYAGTPYTVLADTSEAGWGSL